MKKALAHYQGMLVTKRKVLGLTGGLHVLELVKNMPLFPDNPEGKDVLILELGESSPQRADTPEVCRAFHACIGDLDLRYQTEGRILTPTPVNKKQRRKKLMRRYLWPDVPGSPASAPRWVYLVRRDWLTSTVFEEHPVMLLLALEVQTDGAVDKDNYRPLELEPWEFRLLTRRTLGWLEQNMTECEGGAPS